MVQQFLPEIPLLSEAAEDFDETEVCFVTLADGRAAAEADAGSPAAAATSRGVPLSPDSVKDEPFDTVFLMIDLRCFLSGSWPLTIVEVLPLAGAEVELSLGAVICRVGTLMVCNTQHRTLTN